METEKRMNPIISAIKQRPRFVVAGLAAVALGLVAGALSHEKPKDTSSYGTYDVYNPEDCPSGQYDVILGHDTYGVKCASEKKK